MKAHTIAVASVLLTTPAAAGPPAGPVFSSEPNLRVEYVQFGGAQPDQFANNSTPPCTTDPCIIGRASPAVLGVNRFEAGSYLIHFASGTFVEPPTCTAIGGRTFSQPAMPQLLGYPTGLNWNSPDSADEVALAFFQVTNFAPPLALADQYVSMVCVGAGR